MNIELGVDKAIREKEVKLEALQKKYESVLLKQIYCLHSLRNRLNHNAEILQTQKSDLFMFVKDKGVYDSIPELINPVLEKIDFICKTINGMAQSGLGMKELLKDISPDIEYKILKFVRCLDEQE